MNDSTRLPAYEFDGFRLDTQRRVLFGLDGQPIALTPRLFDALLYFVERAGQLLTKEQLLEAIWPNVIVEEHNLNKTVSELRRALGEKPGEHKFFVTKPGAGYRFVANVSAAPTPRDLRRDTSAAIGADERSQASASRYWAVGALGTAALVAAIAVFGFLDNAPESTLRETPLSFEKGGQSRAVWSPDGRSVAFGVAERSNGPGRIVVRNLDSPTAMPITGDLPARPVPVQWTTTGRILFAEPRGLWSVSPVGATPQLVPGVAFSAADEAVAVTRDGGALALLRYEQGRWSVWTTALAEVAFTKYEVPFVEAPKAGAGNLQFSPDGRQLLVSLASTPPQMWLLPFPEDSRQPPRLALNLPSPDRGFSWMPDNERIVVSASEGQNAPRLHIADTRSGKLRPFTRDGRDNAEPSVSPDGNRLVYLERKGDIDLVSLPLDSVELRPVIVTANREEQGVWAANAPVMAYMSTRSGTYEIWLHREGAVDAPLPMNADFGATNWLFAPSPSPDAARVIFQAVEKSTGVSSLWMASVVSGALERVTDITEHQRAGSWSPDGAWYAYLARGSDGSFVLKKVRTTGRASPEALLAGVDQSAMTPVWSPDGAWILAGAGGLKLIDTQGTTVRDLGIEDSPCVFSRAGNLIHCMRAPQRDGARAWEALDFEGNVVTAVGVLPFTLAPVPREPGGLAPLQSFSMTPDGSAVTYATAIYTQDLWLMEGLSSVDLR